MKHRTSLCSRLLSLLLCAALLAGALPTAVLAADKPDFVSMSIEELNAYLSTSWDPASMTEDELQAYNEAYTEFRRKITYFSSASIPEAKIEAGVVLIGLADTPETREMTFRQMYCADYETVNQTRQRPIAGSPEAFAEQLRLDFPITGARLLNPSVNAEMTPEGEYPFQTKQNNMFRIELGDITVFDAITALSRNPLIEYAQPNYYLELAKPGDGDGKEPTDENTDEAELEALHRQICADFYATYSDPSFPPEDVYIERDCGSYDGCRIVVMNVRGLTMTDDMLYLNVGGYVFTFSSGSYRGLFLAYCDGVFVPMAEAFDKGLLSRKSVRALFDSLKRYRPDFTDVAWNAWYYTAVSDACACRLFNGVGGKRFDPEGDMTRAMLVTVLWRMNGEPYVEGSCPFSDVPDAPNGTWYTRAVIWAAKNKIVEGVGEGRFAPDSPVTREQFVTLLHRLCGKPEPAAAVDGSKFEDFGKVSDWAQDAMRWAIAAGIVTGSAQDDGRTLLNPAGHAARAQAAALLMRYIDSLPDHFTAAEPDPDPVPDPDPKPGTKNLMQGYVSKLDEAPGAISGEAADAMADFTLNMFRAARTPDENAVLSPLSILCALAMLANGAQGETKAQLEQAFGMPVSTLDETLRAFIANLPEGYGDTRIHLANSVWLRDGFAVRPKFLQDNANYLSAGVFQAPFDGTTVKDMNDWVSENTDGMIPRLVNTLSPETVLALMNAIYLRANWGDAYGNTVEQPFHAADGSVQTAQMLCGSENIYLHDDRAAGFIKNFRSDKYAFAVVVPNEGVDLDDYIAGLDGASLRRLLQGERYDAVYTKMPKFKQETSVDLTGPLAAMGIRDAFDPGRCDLKGIAEDLVVSEAKHKAIIDVNEDGVSAAAATYFAAAATAMPMKVISVSADRPYLYMIIDRTTNLPLFIGVNVRMD